MIRRSPRRWQCSVLLRRRRGRSRISPAPARLTSPCARPATHRANGTPRPPSLQPTGGSHAGSGTPPCHTAHPMADRPPLGRPDPRCHHVIRPASPFPPPHRGSSCTTATRPCACRARLTRFVSRPPAPAPENRHQFPGNQSSFKRRTSYSTLKSRPEGCALFIPAIPPRLPPEALKLPGNAGTSHGGRALTGRARYRIMLTYMGS